MGVFCLRCFASLKYDKLARHCERIRKDSRGNPFFVSIVFDFGLPRKSCDLLAMTKRCVCLQLLALLEIQWWYLPTPLVPIRKGGGKRATTPQREGKPPPQKHLTNKPKNPKKTSTQKPKIPLPIPAKPQRVFDI